MRLTSMMTAVLGHSCTFCTIKDRLTCLLEMVYINCQAWVCTSNRCVVEGCFAEPSRVDAIDDAGVLACHVTPHTRCVMHCICCQPLVAFWTKSSHLQSSI